jgi:hypothetical protein
MLVFSQFRDSLNYESNFFQSIRANQTESYVTFGQGIGNIEPLIFEGLVAPYFLLRTNENARWGATLSTPILIRMYSEKSFPVRTPSFMPNITFYHQINKQLDKDDKIIYAFLTFQHHSNGQDEPFYNDDGSLNTKSGDFSTNYIEFGIFLNQKLIPFSHTTEFFKSSVEYHLDFDRSKELEGQYSFLRWHNNFRVNKFAFKNLKSMFSQKQTKYQGIPLVQTKLETTWLFGEINNAEFFNLGERLNIAATISFRPKVLKDVSLFLKYYSGEDYYNMYFYRRINTLQIGLQAFTNK